MWAIKAAEDNIVYVCIIFVRIEEQKLIVSYFIILLKYPDEYCKTNKFGWLPVYVSYFHLG